MLTEADASIKGTRKHSAQPTAQQLVSNHKRKDSVKSNPDLKFDSKNANQNSKMAGQKDQSNKPMAQPQVAKHTTQQMLMIEELKKKLNQDKAKT